MILGLSVDILGSRRIVLERWDCSDAVSVCAEAVDHGPAILADQAGAQLIPAPHRPTLWDAGVVCGVEWPQTSRKKLLVDPLRDRGPAILLEARGIEHSVPQIGIARLSLGDPRAHRLGGHLEPDVRAECAVPLPVPHERAAREQSIRAAFGAGHVVVVGDDRPPAH